MPVTPTYVATSSLIPALITPAAALDPADLLPTVFATVTAGGSGPGSLTTPFNKNAARTDLLGRYGCGLYCVLDGLEVSVSSGLTAAISEGDLCADGPVHIDATTKACSPSVYNWLWALSDGTIGLATSATTTVPSAPAGAQAFLARVHTDGSSILEIDYSGRVTLQQGNMPLRRTADTGAPADTPAATTRFWAKTANGTYIWDGTTWLQLWQPLPLFETTIGASEALVIPAGYGVVVDYLTVAGTLTVSGRLRLV